MKKVLTCILLMLVLFILVGCNEQLSAKDTTSNPDGFSPSNLDKNMALVYYIKDGFLVPVTFEVEKSESVTNSVIDLLFSENVPRGFENKLSDVKLNNFKISGDTISVDISEEFLQGEDTGYKKDQIIYTLTELDNIFYVNIAVNGRTYDTLCERPMFINIVNHEELEQDKSDFEMIKKYLTIYYVDKDKEYLIPVTINSDKIKTQIQNNVEPMLITPEDRARAALQHLIEGPGDITGLNTVFPKDVKVLRNFYIENNVAFVDVNKNLLLSIVNETQYTKSVERIAVQSIVQTLTAIDDIDKVQFLVDGKRMASITGHVNINEPIEVNRWYNLIK